MSDVSDILDGWREQGIRWVRFEAPDLHGASRSKLVPIEQAYGYAADGLNVYGGALVLDSASNVVGGTKYHDEVNYQDQLFWPDPSTAAVVPWADRTARFICESRWYDGRLQGAAPRNVLQRVLDRYTAIGLTPYMGQENEFYLFDPVTKQPALFGGSHIFNTVRNEWHPVVREILDYMPQMGIDIITSNCEYGPSQYEINYGPKFGMAAADATFTFKNGVKEIAQRHGLLATFMSKPSATISGSGAHTHVSLIDNTSGKNVMADARSATGLSTLANQFIAGCLAYAPPAYAIAAPTVNCLKRRRPHTFSPSTISWGIEDRTAMLRVKLGSVSSRHIEYRSPSGLSNPHLVMAVVLASGLLGIEGKLKPPKGSEPGKPAEDDPRNPGLPWSLHESLAALDASTEMRAMLGDEFVDIYLGVKRFELRRFEDHVTDWEVAEYAELY
jgi:glutamine synthetase